MSHLFGRMYMSTNWTWTGVLPQLRQFHASFHPFYQRHPQLTSEEIATILRMYKDRKTNHNIALALSRSDDFIDREIRKLRSQGLIENDKQTWRTISPPLFAAELELLETARDEGQSWRECTKIFPRKSVSLQAQLAESRRQRPRAANVVKSRTIWSKDETRTLIELRNDRKLPFEEIARLMPSRSIHSIMCRYNRAYRRTVPASLHPKIAKPSAWSDKDLAELRRLRAAGRPVAEIALLLGRPVFGVYEKFRADDVAETSGRLPTGEPAVLRGWTAQEEEQLHAHMPGGTGIMQTSRILGRPYASVRSKWERIQRAPVGRPPAEKPRK